MQLVSSISTDGTIVNELKSKMIQQRNGAGTRNGENYFFMVNSA